MPSQHHVWGYHEHRFILFATGYPMVGKHCPLDAGNPCAAGRCHGLSPEKDAQTAAAPG